MSHTKISTDDSPEDSDSSLPDLSPLFQKKVVPISSGDIVFAKFRGLYWPALVKTVYSHQKKISVCYCDEPSKTFKLSIKNVCSFFDFEKRRKIEEDIREAGYSVAFNGLCSHALRYLKRRKNGHNDDPMKFFDQTYPFFLVEKLLKQDPNADVNNLKIPPLYICNEGKIAIKRTTSVSKNKSHCLEIASTDSSEMSDTESSDYVVPTIPGLWKTSTPSTIKYVDKIIKHILSGKADAYLKKIISRTIPSEFYNIYEQSVLDGKKDVGSLSFTGPVMGSNRVNELTSYLLSFADNGNVVNNAPRFKKAISSKTYHNYRKNDVAYFVASVMLPEAIICAIAKIHNVSLSEAKLLFHESPKSYEKVIKNNIASPDVSCEETNIVPKKTRERRIKTTKRRNIERVDFSSKKSDDVKFTKRKNKKGTKNTNSSCSVKSNKMTKPVPNTSEIDFEKHESDESLQVCNLKIETLSPVSISTRSRKRFSCDNVDKIITKSVPNVCETDDNVKRKKSDKNIEAYSSECLTVLPKQIPKKGRKYSKCKLASDVCETGNDVKKKKLDKNIEASSTSECKAVLPKTISKRNRKYLKCKSAPDVCKTSIERYLSDEIISLETVFRKSKRYLS